MSRGPSVSVVRAVLLRSYGETGAGFTTSTVRKPPLFAVTVALTPTPATLTEFCGLAAAS